MSKSYGPIDIEQVNSTTAPPAGQTRLYTKPDGNLYYVGTDGVEHGVPTSRISSSPLASPPSNPAVNDLWIVTDQSSITGSTGSVGEIDHVDFSNPVDLSALTTTYVDLDGYSIDVAAQSQPYMLSMYADIASNTGTAAAGSNVVYLFKVVDVTNGSTWIYVPITVQQIISTNYQFQGVINGSRRIAPHTSPRTYKVQARVLNAIPANWGGAGLLAHDAPAQGVYPPAYLRAEYT